MFSIIIPVYNVEKFLPQCLDSVLAQTYANFELILVDDGSNDRSGEYCDDYSRKDSRVRVFHVPNGGVSAARNIGIDEARGKWITFVDSDDFIDSDYLEKFHVEIGDADLIIQGLEYYDDKCEKYFKQVRVIDGVVENECFKQFVAENNLLHSGYPVAKAFRCDLIKNGPRFNTSISYHEDHIFVLMVMSIVNKIRLEDSVAYKYRVYHNGISLSTKRHSWRNLNMASELMVSAINNLHDMYLVKNSLYERKIYNFAYAPKIRAVFEIFRLTESMSDKKKALAVVINRNDLITYYKPFLFVEKLMKYILCNTPFFVKNIFFSLYIMYQNKR